MFGIILFYFPRILTTTGCFLSFLKIFFSCFSDKCLNMSRDSRSTTVPIEIEYRQLNTNVSVSGNMLMKHVTRKRSQFHSIPPKIIQGHGHHSDLESWLAGGNVVRRHQHGPGSRTRPAPAPPRPRPAVWLWETHTPSLGPSVLFCKIKRSTQASKVPFCSNHRSLLRSRD